MRIRFTDDVGETGYITEDLTLVDYDGPAPLRELIEEALSTLEGGLVKVVSDTEGMEFDPNIHPPCKEVPMEGKERMEEVVYRLPRLAPGVIKTGLME